MQNVHLLNKCLVFDPLPARQTGFMKVSTLAATLLIASLARAQSVPVSLPAVTVYSPSVANQMPAGSFAMPVSALRYEPLVDIQARSQPEGGADVTIRGGTFEATGLQVGAATILDPQTGHYLEQLPIAPEMLGAPRILTGSDHALQTMNSTVGAVAYDWRPVQSAGAVSIGVGNDGLVRADLYEGHTVQVGSGVLAADADWAHAEGNGTVDFGDFKFNRADGRVQWRQGAAQTDAVIAYQTNFLGWPNLYTPFDSDETDSLQTLLVSANHRVDLGGGQSFEATAFWRRNKDDYAFSRFAPLGTVHPFQHTTWIGGLALGGLQSVGVLSLGYHAEMTEDDLRSTALIYGHYHSRELEKLALAPEREWILPDGAVTARAGATLDASNRASSALSPVADLSRTWNSGTLTRAYASFAETTQLPSYTALDSSPTSGLFLGNENLGREVSRSSEIGVEGGSGGWTVKSALFYRRDSNLVDWTYLQGVFGRRANAVDVATSGAEFTARRSWAACDLVLGYTVLTKASDYHGAQVTASFYSLNYARQRATAALTLHVSGEWEVKVDSEARVQEPNALRSGDDNAFRSTVGVYYRPKALRGWEFSAQVDNVTGSSFQEIPAVPAAGRQAALTVTYGW